MSGSPPPFGAGSRRRRDSRGSRTGPRSRRSAASRSSAWRSTRAASSSCALSGSSRSPYCADERRGGGKGRHVVRRAHAATAADAGACARPAWARRSRRGSSRRPRRCRAAAAAPRGRRSPTSGTCDTVARSAFASSGVNARSACWTRLPSCPSTSAGTSFGVWVTKKTPTPFERISRTVCSTESRNASVASSNSRCASSKKKTSFGLGRSPASGSVSNSSATSHISAVDHSSGWSCTPGSSRHEITPRPSGVEPQQVGDRRTAARRRSSLPPPSSSSTSERSRTPTVAGDRPPMPFELRLALVGVEAREQRAQVGEVDERQPLLVGVVEDQAQALLLRLVRARGPWRAAAGRSPTRSRAPARRRRCRRARGTRPGSARGAYGEPELGGRFSAAGVRLAGRRQPGDVALHVGDEHGHAGRRELLGDQLQRPASCRCRWRRRSARGGSSSPAGCGRPPPAPPRRSWTPRPSSMAAPSVA